jgi:hypothetical protein
MPSSGSLQRRSVSSRYEMTVSMDCLDSTDGSLRVDSDP